MRLLVLTGAGISAESGIPTFRGKDGYWVEGSRHYAPQEMATWRMFRHNRRAFWTWYLSRFSVCLRVKPNAGHHALVRLEAALGDDFTLITQNIDGLHARAGQSSARTYCIHGNLGLLRCSEECRRATFPLPEDLKREMLDPAFEPEARWDALHCPHCGAPARPHVLLFDEMYDEGYYRYASSLRAAEAADRLLIVGTTGATNLPNLVVQRVWARRKPIDDVNVERNDFTLVAEKSPGGRYLDGPAGEILPLWVDAFLADLGQPSRGAA